MAPVALPGAPVRGPNLKMQDKEMLDEEPKYFSVRWFLSGENAQRAGYGGL